MEISNHSYHTEKQEGAAIWDVAALFLLLIILVVFFSPLLFGDRVIFFRDFTLITYPFKSFLSQIYHQGAIPFWTPSTVHGTPFMAAFHPGVFYPPSLFFLMDDLTMALNIFYLFHFLALGWGVYLLNRSWGVTITGAVCSSVTAMLGGFFLGSTLISNFFLSGVWLPLVFYFFQNYLIRKRARDFIGAVFCLACETLAACPEICIMTVLLLFFKYVVSAPREKTILDWVRPSTALAVVVALSLSLSALQLLPTYKMVSLSERHGGLPFEAHSEWSLEYQALPSIVLPGEFKDLNDSLGDEEQKFLESVYMGIFSLLFLGLSVLFWKERRIRFWAIVFFTGIFFALGKNNPLYQYFYSWTPLMDLFRYPEKYYFISAFALVFLSGLGLDALVRGTINREIKTRHVIAVILILFAGAGLTALWKTERNPGPTFVFLIAFGLLYLTFYFKKLGVQKFKFLFFVLLLFEIVTKGYGILPLVDKQFFEDEPVLATEIKKDNAPYRVYTGRIQTIPNKFLFPNGPSFFSATLGAKEHLFPYLGIIYGVEYPDGIPGLALELTDHWLWREILKRSDPERRIRILKRSNVKYWIDGDTPTPYSEGFPLILPDRLKVFEDALPRAFLVNKVRFDREPRLLNIYYSESFEPLSEVLLSKPVKWKEIDGFEGEVEDIQYKPNHVKVRTRQNGDGFLVLLDSWFPGWKVKIDGKEGKILRANHFFRAVKLGPGRHTVEFDYIPEGFKTGLAITMATLMVLLFVSIWIIRKNRLNPPKMTRAIL